MRMRCRSGTSSGMVALKAGPRNADMKPQTAVIAITAA